MVWSDHRYYFNNPKVIQAALSLATGVNVPLGYSRSSIGFFTDPYNPSFFGTFNVQQTVIYFSPEVQTIQTSIVTNYGVIQQPSLVPDYNFSPNFQSPDFNTWNGSSFQSLPQTYLFPSSNYSLNNFPTYTNSWDNWNVPTFNYVPPVMPYVPPPVNNWP